MLFFFCFILEEKKGNLDVSFLKLETLKGITLSKRLRFFGDRSGKNLLM